MHAGNLGWIELVAFYGIAIGIGVWQWVKMDRMLKRTRAEQAARAADEARPETEPER
ncbi:hypothetical protein [Erythrobacter cryptus]|uniref:hypothetical protein n=1 Tax=Erythrobacter cryptus TaxID=196588 RepID=UPI00040122DA|nr:hypothetical protein [Erythrobacter cryptus]